MSETKNPSNAFDKLRRRAETILMDQLKAASYGSAQWENLIREINVYQEALAIQNEDLVRAKEALAGLNRELWDLYEFAPCGFLTLGTDGVIRRINLRATAMIGDSGAGKKRKKLNQFLAPQSRDAYFQALLKARESGHRQQAELMANGGDNKKPLWIKADIQAVQDDTGQIAQYNLALNDISQIKETENELRASEQLLLALVDNVAIGISLISPGMEILKLNRQMKKWYPDIEPREKPLCYASFNDPPRSDICPYCPTIQTLRDGSIHEAITETPAAGNVRNYRVVSSPIRDERGNVIAAIEMVDDITETRRTSEQIRNLTRKLIESQETERLMISRELHDRLAQDLAFAKMHCDGAVGSLSRENHPAQSALKKASEMLNHCIAEVRRLAYDLRPPGLQQLGLGETLSNYCKDLSRAKGIAVDLQIRGLGDHSEMGGQTPINLYRLVQEGLNNVIKHAGATRVSIHIAETPQNIQLNIQDNGKGFDVQQRLAEITDEKKMGLRSMQERTELLGGVMTVASEPGRGTRIAIKIPSRPNPPVN